MNSTLKAEDMIAVLFKCAEGCDTPLMDYVYDSSLSDEEVIEWFSKINSLEVDIILR